MTDSAASLKPRPDPFRDIRRTTYIGLAMLAVGVSTVGVWAATAPLASAVIAPAQVVVDSNVRRVQHPTGGVVAEILVNDGDRVKAGDVLVRLDETMTRANLALIENQLNQFWTRRARLRAEQDGRDSFVIPKELADRNEPAIADIIDGETSLLLRRREAIAGQQSQLRERGAQIGEEIHGLTAQIDSKREQTRLIQRELEGVRQLFEKNLIPYARLTTLEREAARLTGEEGQLIAETARAKGRIAEIELQTLQVVQDQRREIATDLRETEIKIADLSERRIAALDQLARVVLRAPQDGMVHQKSVHTVGGVITAGEQLMLIIPEKDSLVVEARVDPQMIDRLRLGQSAKLRFPAFDTAITPDLDGRLTRVAADLTKDQQSGISYYVARIALDDGELAKLGGKALVPGMPVEAYIQNGSRTAFAYLRKPLEDQLARAFRHN